MTHILKGNFVFSTSYHDIQTIENGYAVIEKGKIVNIFEKLPHRYQEEELIDYSDKLIIPGFVDLNFNAALHKVIGQGSDLSVVEWNHQVVYPEVKKFDDINYANETYKKVVLKLWNSGTTRVVAYGTPHIKSTGLLIKYLQGTGLGARVGIRYSDKDTPDEIAVTPQQVKEDTAYLMEHFIPNGFVSPVLALNNISSCSQELLQTLSKLSKKYKLPIASYLSIKPWTTTDHEDPDTAFSSMSEYLQASGLVNKQTKTIWSNGYFMSPADLDFMKENNIIFAHTPSSLLRLPQLPASHFYGQELVEKEIQLGLGSGLGLGYDINMLSVIRNTLAYSRIHATTAKKHYETFDLKGTFYMSTLGGGKFFGKVGSFLPGYEFDALVIDDSTILDPKDSLFRRFERFIFQGSSAMISHRYIRGIYSREPSFSNVTL